MKRYLDFLPLPFLILTAWEYAHAWSEERAEIVISTQISPPYAYRILIPLLCRFLSKFSGISALTAISLVSIAFSIGLFFVIRSLLNRPWASLLAFLFCECLLFLLLWRMKVYDVPTVFFFALAILLFQRGKLAAYY